jgi:hypothetical protein
MPKVKNEIVIVPKIKIHPNKIVLYNEINYSHFKPSRTKDYSTQTSLITVEKDGKLQFERVNNNFLNSSRTSNGTLSNQAKKRLKTAIEYLLFLNKPTNGKTGNTGRHYQNQITFITLTLPAKQTHTDKEIKEKCLNQFLIEMHKFNRISNYVWRAEYQNNGNIHFHILVNRFIPYADIRTRWNRIINKLGYVNEYRYNQMEWHKNGFRVRLDNLAKWSIEKQLKAYEKGMKENWENPNSTDIHSIKNITNIKAYITKYLTKTDQVKELQTESTTEHKNTIGRMWAASVVLSNIKGADTEIDSFIGNEINFLRKHFKKAFFESHFFTVIDIDINMIEKTKCLSLFHLFYRYLEREFSYNHQLSF